jgi:hypothetical protein
MLKCSNTRPLCAALMGLLPVVASSADVPACDGRSSTLRAEAPAATDQQTSGSGQYASEVPADEVNSIEEPITGGDSEDSIPVANEVSFVVGNDFRTRGGYDETLKHVAEVNYYGTRYLDCEHYPLEIHAARPDRITSIVSAGPTVTHVARKSGNAIVIRGRAQGIPSEIERALLETFDFDTPIVALENKDPAVAPAGMQKLPGTLAWMFKVKRAGPHYRILYVDSHFGDVVRFIIKDAAGAVVVDVALHDYRAVEGIRVPFAADYHSAEGTLLASDRFERVEVKRTGSWSPPNHRQYQRCPRDFR